MIDKFIFCSTRSIEAKTYWKQKLSWSCLIQTQVGIFLETVYPYLDLYECLKTSKSSFVYTYTHTHTFRWRMYKLHTLPVPKSQQRVLARKRLWLLRRNSHRSTTSKIIVRYAWHWEVSFGAMFVCYCLLVQPGNFLLKSLLSYVWQEQSPELHDLHRPEIASQFRIGTAFIPLKFSTRPKKCWHFTLNRLYIIAKSIQVEVLGMLRNIAMQGPFNNAMEYIHSTKRY